MTKEGYISKLRRSRFHKRGSSNCPLLTLALIACTIPIGTLLGAARVGATSTEGGQVTSVRFWSLGEMTRVAIEVSSPFTYSANRLSAPDRLFFDIRGASPAMAHKGIRSMPVNNALVNQIRIAENEPRVTRVVLDLVKPVTVSTSQLANPYRLIVELKARDAISPASKSPITSQSPANAGETKSISASVDRVPNSEQQPVANPLPSVADLAKESTLRENSLQNEIAISESRSVHRKPEPKKFEPPPSTRKAHTPVVYLEPEVPAPPKLALAKPVRLPSVSTSPMRDLPPPPAAEAASVSSNLPVPVSTVPVGDPPAAASRPSLGDPSLTRVLGLKLGRIVLDPGHGGQDLGTHGPSGYAEKDLVLDVAQRLGALLEQRLGSEVVYTRSDDTFIGLEERTHVANQRKADLFLSIHANSSPYRSAAGVETYVLNFTPSKAANDLAARENASSSSSIHDLRNLVEKIASADKANESREFAAKLQYSLSALSTRSNDAARNRGVKRAPFVVLIGAGMPSVLAEIGFLSNRDDETLLRNPDHRQKIAEALYKGIAAYAETLSRFNVAHRN